jgi:NAD(P)-dependent dehydrogenase (short-subunit alcohol dehydrogenase family)
MQIDYSGKRVILTGGFSGVGAALLGQLADMGAPSVTVLDLKAPSGPHDTFIQTDLSSEDAVEAAIAQIEGPIDVLFNNAGVADTLPKETVYAVNVLAMRRLATGLLPQINPGGAIVLTDSIAGLGWPERLATIQELLAIDDWDVLAKELAEIEVATEPYMFSKEMGQVFTMVLAPQATKQGVRVNSVCPAPIDTPLLDDFRKTMTDAVIDWMLSNGAGRPVSADEVASTLAWIGSPAAEYVNGINLTMDGGFNAAMTTGQVDFSTLG